MIKLSHKYLLIVTGITIVLACVFLYTIPRLVKNVYIDEVILRLNIISNYDVDNIDKLPMNYRYVHFDDFINYQAYDDAGYSFRLQDELYRVIISKIKTQTSKIEHYNYSESLGIIFVIRKDDLGFNVAYTFSNSLNNISVDLINDLYLLIIIVYVFLVGLTAILAGRISKPIKELQRHVENITNQNWGRVITMRRQDEIGELATEIETMRVELIERDRIIREMLQNMSHDLKTPVMVIQAYLESAIDHIYPHGSLEKTLSVAYDETKRLDRKIRNLIHYAKLENLEEKAELNELIDMNKLIANVVERFKYIRPIELKTCTEASIFSGNYGKWEVVIENIIENFMRYADTIIVITVQPDVVTFFNDGPHFEKGLEKALFLPYSHGRDGNYGIGLAIVYQTVTRYGYKVEAYNVNHGVEFKISK